MATATYIKTKNHNTNYYRRNKLEKFCVHKCPHCNYETTGPKQCIQAHIWAKHTPEHKKPFQCPCGNCNRGMASRANLKKHLKETMKLYFHLIQKGFSLSNNIKKAAYFK